MSEEKSTQLDDSQLAEIVTRLETRVLARPNNARPILKLLNFLDLQSPNTSGEGPYSRCQRALADQFQENDLSQIKTNPDHLIFLVNEWRRTLTRFEINKKTVNSQIHQGRTPKINDQPMQCESFLKFFDENNAIPGTCFSCFKVQILSDNVFDLMRLNFAMKNLDLKRDNSRKCMVEMRENVPYPYKGYIYCASEEEAFDCLNELNSKLQEFSLLKLICGISHGCSEYSMKYPEFKYSKEGKHRDFKQPENWRNLERSLLKTESKQGVKVLHRNNSKITLHDVMCFENWIRYAEMIGDQSYQLFQDVHVGETPGAFVKLMAKQAAARKAQIAELQQRQTKNS